MMNQLKWIVLMLPLYLLGMGGENEIWIEWNGDGYPDRISWDEHTVALSINRMGLLQPAGRLRKYPDDTIQSVRATLNDEGVTVELQDGSRDFIGLNTPLISEDTPTQLPVYDPPPNVVDFDLTFTSPPNYYRYYVCGAADLDDDGADELLTATYEEYSPYTYATLQVWKTTGDNELALFDTVPGIAHYTTESVVRNIDILNDGDRWTVSSHKSMGGSDRMVLKINNNNNLISHSLFTSGVSVYSSDFTDLDQDNLNYTMFLF